MTETENRLFCSFCGKSQHEVRALISGGSACICDECVEVCIGILLERCMGDAEKVGDGPEQVRMLADVISIMLHTTALLEKSLPAVLGLLFPGVDLHQRIPIPEFLMSFLDAVEKARVPDQIDEDITNLLEERDMLATRQREIAVALKELRGMQ